MPGSPSRRMWLKYQEPEEPWRGSTAPGSKLPPLPAAQATHRSHLVVFRAAEKDSDGKEGAFQDKPAGVKT